MLCSNYIGGSVEYTCDELIDIMEQMNWFFTKTNYSSYSKQYDNERYEARKSSYYDYGYRYGETLHYYGSRKYYYDSDSDDSDDSDYYESREREKQEYNKRKSEYVKKRCLKEWIGNGKRGTYPQCLIPLIEQVEKEMEKEKNQPKQPKQQKILNTSKTNPCSNPSCLNIHSLACANKMCRICCNGVGCEIHKKSIKSVKTVKTVKST